jgi:predicted nicotinamide N-methyase
VVVPDGADDLVTEHVVVGELTIQLVRPRRPDDLVDEDEFARDEFLPYWAELWPSALALARVAVARGLTGGRVLELGCGLGLPSIAAAVAGSDVLATDWSEDALRFTRRNAALNRTRVATALVDWRSPPPLSACDLVLGADLLYEARNAGPLLALLATVVAPDGEALIADPGRRHAEAFIAAASAEWHVETLPAPELPRGAVHRLWRG